MSPRSPGGNRNRPEKRVLPLGKSRGTGLAPAAPGLGALYRAGDGRAVLLSGAGPEVGGPGASGEKRREPRGGWGPAPLSGDPAVTSAGPVPRKRVVWSRGAALLFPRFFSIWGPPWVLAVWEESRW